MFIQSTQHKILPGFQSFLPSCFLTFQTQILINKQISEVLYDQKTSSCYLLKLYLNSNHFTKEDIPINIKNIVCLTFFLKNIGWESSSLTFVFLQFLPSTFRMLKKFKPTSLMLPSTHYNLASSHTPNPNCFLQSPNHSYLAKRRGYFLNLTFPVLPELFDFSNYSFPETLPGFSDILGFPFLLFEHTVSGTITSNFF